MENTQGEPEDIHLIETQPVELDRAGSSTSRKVQEGSQAKVLDTQKEPEDIQKLVSDPVKIQKPKRTTRKTHKK